jgi:hypothetical protein
MPHNKQNIGIRLVGQHPDSLIGAAGVHGGAMPNIELEEAIKIAAADEFWAVRAKAIQAYANLEQAMATLFSALAGIKRETRAIIFFKIASSDARNKIVEALFKKFFDDRFDLFRNSLFNQLKPLDRERNEVVHWNAVCRAGHDGTETTAVVALAPANIYGIKDPTLKTVDDLRTFDAKAQFYARLINMFALMTCEITPAPIPEANRKPWLDIFAQPIAYPPSSDHPLFPKPGTPENHIQAFLV